MQRSGFIFLLDGVTPSVKNDSLRLLMLCFHMVTNSWTRLIYLHCWTVMDILRKDLFGHWYLLLGSFVLVRVLPLLMEFKICGLHRYLINWNLNYASNVTILKFSPSYLILSSFFVSGSSACYLFILFASASCQYSLCSFSDWWFAYYRRFYFILLLMKVHRCSFKYS